MGGLFPPMGSLLEGALNSGRIVSTIWISARCGPSGLTEQVPMKSDSKMRARFAGFLPLAALMAAGASLAGCSEDPGGGVSTRAYQPLSSEMLALMQEKSTTQNAPMLIRAYKKEAEFEVWKMASDGHYVLLKTYPMCRWSGQLGPKVREGDRQVPEGFYTITPAQMNPHSAYYLSFNVGYPNAYDRAHGYSGGSIMVHGACSSAGCFSMTDQEIAEIYSLARDSFLGGQHAIQMQSLPFHMTAENVAKYRLDPNIDFWKELKVGTDNFEVTRQDVAVGVCNSRYVFNQKPADGTHFEPTEACPPMKQDDALRAAVAAKEKSDATKVAEFIAQGVKPVRTVYADGGQNASFSAHYIPGVSRPDALAQGPVDVALDDKPATKVSPVVQVAAKGKDKDKTKQPVQVAATTSAVANASAASQPAAPQATAEAPGDAPKSNGWAATSMIASLWGGKTTQSDQQPADPSLANAAAPAEVVGQPANVPLPPTRR
jgi:murein L,D-transpeptidase YafK